jgi:hypothetical protein
LDRAPSADLATTVFAQDGKLIEFFSPIGSELCLDSPLPCTPFLNYMPWRDAASIKAGFPPLNCVKEGAPCSDLVEKTVNLFDTQGISNEAKSTGES